MTHSLVELREESIFSPLFFIFLEHFILRHDVSDILCTTTQEYQELVKVVQEKAGDSSDEAEEMREVLVDSIFYFSHVVDCACRVKMKAVIIKERLKCNW